MHGQKSLVHVDKNINVNVEFVKDTPDRSGLTRLHEKLLTSYLTHLLHFLHFIPIIPKATRLLGCSYLTNMSKVRCLSKIKPLSGILLCNWFASFSLKILTITNQAITLI